MTPAIPYDLFRYFLPWSGSTESQPTSRGARGEKPRGPAGFCSFLLGITLFLLFYLFYIFIFLSFVVGIFNIIQNFSFSFSRFNSTSIPHSRAGASCGTCATLANESLSERTAKSLSNE